MSSTLRAGSTSGELSSAGSERTLTTSTGGSSHTHSHRKHNQQHHHHRSRSAPRAPEKPPRKRHVTPGHSLASIPSQIKLSMLNSGLISFGESDGLFCFAVGGFFFVSSGRRAGWESVLEDFWGKIVLTLFRRCNYVCEEFNVSIQGEKIETDVTLGKWAWDWKLFFFSSQLCVFPANPNDFVVYRISMHLRKKVFTGLNKNRQTWLTDLIVRGICKYTNIIL